MILPLRRKRRTTRPNTHRSTVTEPTGSISGTWTGKIRRFSAWCLCSAVIASGLQAADPAPPRVSPLDRLKERSAAQRWQESRDQYLQETPRQATRITAPAADTPAVTATASAATENKGALQPEPLDLPLSDFDRGRTGQSSSRPPLPSMVKSVPGPYFDSAPAGAEKSPLISLPDFLDTPAAASTVAQLPTPESAVPPAPAPGAIGSQTPVPLPEESGASGIPGLDDNVFRPISQIQPYYDYSPTGKRPFEYICPQPSHIPDNERARCPEIQPLPAGGSTDRHYALIDFQWLPSNLHHKPLYFQDVALERYGQKYPCGLQPFVSVGKFAVQGIGLPYQIAIDPLWRDIYPLGYYRPGDAAPELIYQVPLDLKAAAAAGGVYTGLIFLLP